MADAPLKTMKCENWEHDNLNFVLSAISYVFKTLKDKFPKAHIYCLINTELKAEISAETKKACQIYGITE